MGQPSVTDVHIDRISTRLSVGYFQDMRNFMGTNAFGTPVKVKNKSDKYFKYAKDSFLRDEMKLRAPGTESAGSGYGLSTDSYSAEVYALHKDISDQERENSDEPLDPDADATAWLTHKAALNLETSWINAFFVAGKWATDVTPGVLWSTPATSDPIANILTGKETVLASTGREPNTLILGYQVANVLREHPDFIDRIKYTTSDAVTTDIMARLFGVDRVFIASSIKATAEEGAATQTYGFMHGKNALLAYVEPTPSIRSVTAGVTLMWEGISQGLGETVAVKRFRMEPIASDRLEIQIAYAHKIVAPDLGYFFSAVVA